MAFTIEPLSGRNQEDKPVSDTLTPPPVAMKALKYLSFAGKLAGFVSALNVIPFIDPTIGIVVFAAASILKDTVNRVGDLLDDGQPNSSFRS